MLLTAAELVDLTRRERPAAQARVLRAMGVAFRVHPSDGVLLVSRAAAEGYLGGPVLVAANDAEGEIRVNVEGIRRHGKTKKAG